MGYQFVIGLVTGVRYPACDISVCHFPKRSEVRGAYLIISDGGFFKYFVFIIYTKKKASLKNREPNK
jgi:hypothetical protein